jgi:hypothetical protein
MRDEIALDIDAFVRDAYVQRRRNAIDDGHQPNEDADDGRRAP